MKGKLLKYLKANKKYAISLISRLIEMPTVNPPGKNYENLVFVLEKECRKLGLDTKKYITPKNVLRKFDIKGGSERISLVANWHTGAKKTLHINSHYDVVPATDKWDTDPFKAVIKGNRIYGRGSEDMKGNIACVLFAINAVRNLGIKPKINLAISFTPDEETGGRTGLGYLINKGLVKADYAMSEGYSGNYVSMGNKGVLWAEVEVNGKSCHASIPYNGVNAFDRMVELATELNKLKVKIGKRKTKYSMRDNIAKSPTFVMGGVLEGGVKVNVVPGVAKFSIDRRLIPEESVDAAKKQIENVINRFNKRHKDSFVSVRFMSQEPPSISKKHKVFFDAVSGSIKAVTGKRPEFCLMPGATDMRYFMWKGVPSLGYSAKGGESWHSDNEFVYINSLIETAAVYALIISRLT